METRQRHEKKKLSNKWASTVASILIQSTSGNLYTFSVYSPALKSTQGYSQSTLDTISVFKDFGANCGVLSGLLYSYANDPRRRGGPWVVHLAGAAQNLLGYSLMWACVAGILPRPPVAAVCLFMLVAAHAQSFFNTANVVTAVRNFPDYSGTAVGIMKGFIGLSGAILIQIYQTVFNKNPAAFLLMLALLPTINALLLMWFVRIYNASAAEEKKRLNALSLVALVIAAYLMVVIILENIFKWTFLLHLSALVLLLLLLFSPVYVAARALQGEFRNAEQTQSTEGVDQNSDLDRLECYEKTYYGEEDPTGSDYQILPGDINEEISKHEDNDQQLERDLHLSQAMCTVDFWILFLAMACGMGSGLATVNNIGQIGGSLGYTSEEVNSMISLWSIWNFLGRFGAGFVSDFFLHTKGSGRPLFMAITLAALSVGHAVIGSGLPGALYVGSVLVGVCYGSQWSLMPTIASEIFGVNHMGTIFNTITMANPVGSYILSIRVIGYIYDKEASGKGHKCEGTKCFMLSFFIMAGATLLGSLAALLLFFRTRYFYSQVILRRIQHSSRL
ncbi:protein NUCLEAR FUSION DEFECTIVE 4-like [Rhodamnia argentea]|uniref:Protein NUCLEAR FUSION DEFECTIVE 4-like n=1 Tax=Rhodamnia argentea TaxID=178133 RepID=A0A8B8NH94_9MYRT|nr:protein NUCLEAR FUSION DEFECTIVE 4-like [Rhodamnia argentea]